MGREWLFQKYKRGVVGNGHTAKTKDENVVLDGKWAWKRC